jgi:hypothetical protein
MATLVRTIFRPQPEADQAHAQFDRVVAALDAKLPAAAEHLGDAREHLPRNSQAEVKTDYWAIFDVPEGIEPGPDAVRHVQARIDSFARRWRDCYPAAVRCLLADRDSLTVYLRFPREHWTRIRHPHHPILSVPSPNIQTVERNPASGRFAPLMRRDHGRGSRRLRHDAPSSRTPSTGNEGRRVAELLQTAEEFCRSSAPHLSVAWAPPAQLLPQLEAPRVRLGRGDPRRRRSRTLKGAHAQKCAAAVGRSAARVGGLR